jgi:hypothetical protein
MVLANTGVRNVHLGIEDGGPILMVSSLIIEHISNSLPFLTEM